MTDITTAKPTTPTQDSDLMTILRGTDEAAKMAALEEFTFKPGARSTGEGNHDDYSTETLPDSFDELLDAVGVGLISRAQVEALRQVLYERSLRKQTPAADQAAAV